MGNPSGQVAQEDIQSQVSGGPKIPIAVEESRAHRLQRQQARFRDRGGIFVPSNRNTLGDILCGRSAAPSPRKPRKRSESVSPRKGKRSSFPEGKVLGPSAIATQVPGKRTSPRKLSKKLVYTEPEANLEPIAGPSRLDEDTKPVQRPLASRKGKRKADDASQKPAPKRRGRPPKTKVHPEASEEMEDTSKKVIELPHSKSMSKAKSKSMKVAASKSTAKATGSRTTRKRSTKATEVEVGGDLISDTANGDVVPEQGYDENGKAKGRGMASPVVETGTTVKPNSISRNKKSARLTEDGHGTNPSDSDPGKPLPRRSHPTKVKGAYLELQNDGEAKPPIPSAERLGKSRKQAAKNAKQPEAATVEENQEPEEPERMKSASKKRTRPHDARDKDGGDDIHNGSIQASRKRPKAAQRTGSEPEGEATAVKKTKASGQASEKHVENSDQVMPLTDKPTSKKRSREPGLEGPQVELVIEKPQKRMKPTLAEDKPTLVIEALSRNVDQRGGNAKKILKLESRKHKENTAATTGEAAKPLKETKLSTTKLPSKLKGPPASVLKRVKQPLPGIEDDDPDPINFLL